MWSGSGSAGGAEQLIDARDAQLAEHERAGPVDHQADTLGAGLPLGADEGADGGGVQERDEAEVDPQHARAALGRGGDEVLTERGSGAVVDLAPDGDHR